MSSMGSVRYDTALRAPWQLVKQLVKQLGKKLDLTLLLELLELDTAIRTCHAILLTSSHTSSHLELCVNTSSHTSSHLELCV